MVSKRSVENVGGAMNRQNAEAPSLAVKVCLMIGTQLASWLSFIGAAVYFQIVSESPPPLLFEVLALIVLPINSLLNPIFYSGLYKKIYTFIRTGLKRLFRKDSSSSQDPVEN